MWPCVRRPCRQILKYSRPIAELLSRRFGDRFHLIEGNSMRTLEPWVVASTAKGVTCDLTFVDGDHEGTGARRDMQKLARVTAPARHNRLVVVSVQREACHFT